MLVFWGVKGPSFVSMDNSSIKIFKNPYFPNSKAHRIIFQVFLGVSWDWREGPGVVPQYRSTIDFASVEALKPFALSFSWSVCELFVGKRGVGRHFFLPAKKTPRRSKNNKRLNMRMTSRTRPQGVQQKADESRCIPRWAGPWDNPSRYKWGDGDPTKPYKWPKIHGFVSGV